MGLVKCQMCEKEISPNAISCPCCGEPMNTKGKTEVVHTEESIIYNLEPIISVKGEIFINEENDYKEAMLFICKEFLIVTDISRQKIILTLLYNTVKDLVSNTPFLLSPEEDAKRGFFAKLVVKKPVDNSRYVFNVKGNEKEFVEFRIVDEVENKRYQSESFKMHFDLISNANLEKYINTNNSFNMKCPTCSSTNVYKISATSKAGSALVFGVFSLGYISKTFKCESCGYKW